MFNSISVVICSSVMLVGAMLYMTFTPVCHQCYNVLPGSFMFGLAYALYVPTLWTSPVYLNNRVIVSCRALVKRKSIGIAYGFIGAVRNLGVSLVTIFSGMLLDKRGYYSV